MQGRGAGGLAHVFLRQTDDPAVVAGWRAVETLDDEHLLILENGDFAVGDGDAVSRQNFGAQPFVLDRAAHVGLHVADQAHREFEDVRGRGAVPGKQPFSIALEQGGFFLGAGNG